MFSDPSKSKTFKPFMGDGWEERREVEEER